MLKKKSNLIETADRKEFVNEIFTEFLNKST